MTFSPILINYRYDFQQFVPTFDVKNCYFDYLFHNHDYTTTFREVTMKFFIVYLLAVNIAGFIAFGVDKYKAIHDKWRIRESTLMLFALLGGSPGCLAGMYLFHHKTKHRLFTIGVPVILVLELLLGCFAFYTYQQQLPYDHDPQKLVKHELSLLQTTDSEKIDNYLSYQDIFPTETTDKTIPDEIESVFSDFFKSFTYHIEDVNTEGDTSEVTVSLNTLDGKQIAREYSRRALTKQIQNSATPAGVDFSLEDCYLLLGTVLEENTFDTVRSKYTISLTRNGKIWSISSPDELGAALTGDFAAYVSDADLFTPSEIVEIHLDTLKGFDVEQLNRYLALDNLFSVDMEYKRTISRALDSQLLKYLDYRITSETISEDKTTATVNMELTSCDCSFMMNQYREKVTAYTSTAQALQDGIEGRLGKANDLLVKSITENTSSVTSSVTIHLRNDGASWRLEMNDEMGEALLGKISEAVAEISEELGA